jgi:hypothetical protein
MNPVNDIRWFHLPGGNLDLSKEATDFAEKLRSAFVKGNVSISAYSKPPLTLPTDLIPSACHFSHISSKPTENGEPETTFLTDLINKLTKRYRGVYLPQDDRAVKTAKERAAKIKSNEPVPTSTSTKCTAEGTLRIIG